MDSSSLIPSSIIILFLCSRCHDQNGWEGIFGEAFSLLYASLERRRSPTASLRRSGNHDQGKKFQNPPKIRAAKIVAQKHNDQISASNLCFTFVNLVFQLGLTFTSVDRFRKVWMMLWYSESVLSFLSRCSLLAIKHKQGVTDFHRMFQFDAGSQTFLDTILLHAAKHS